MNDFFIFEINLFCYNFRHYFPRSGDFFRAKTNMHAQVISFRSILHYSNREFGTKKTIITNLVYLFLFFFAFIALDAYASIFGFSIASWAFRILAFFLLLWKFDVFRLHDAYSFLIACLSLITLVFWLYFSISLVFVVALTNYVALTTEKEENE